LTTAQEESTCNTPGSANYTFGDIATIGNSGASGALGGVSGLADPNDRLVPTTTAYLAYLLSKNGDTAGAVEYSRMAVSAAPGWVDAWINLAAELA